MTPKIHHLLATWALMTSLVFATEFERTDPIKIGGGNLVVAWPKSTKDQQLSHEGRHELLIHFHGDPDVVLREAGRANVDHGVAILNFHGLSSAYRKPFEHNASLFEQVLDQVGRELRKAGQVNADSIEGPLILSSFSAGYGAVREILKSPIHADRIQGYLAADSIYASIVASDEASKSKSVRLVEPTHMKDFLELARRSAKSEKFFLITHSDQPTSYASTTETANYLARQLSVPRAPTESNNLTATWAPVSKCRRGAFEILGYEGTNADAHLQHLRQIGDAFQRLSELQATLKSGRRRRMAEQ